ncbi:BnaCnng41160D [Brassica napus]|uniref:(rape) hypothetical protein n=1 Tax=Brassica napus TaxID=3708 RepID=A0A078JDJ0_BRANA|nr:unnamed protein product [Brassica napus]CDY62974.1 BnaCnng41160D [Brassica napus]
MATVANFSAKPIATVIPRPSSAVASTSSFVLFVRCGVSAKGGFTGGEGRESAKDSQRRGIRRSA